MKFEDICLRKGDLFELEFFIIFAHSFQARKKYPASDDRMDMLNKALGIAQLRC